jgi:phage baseplate assembly protein W
MQGMNRNTGRKLSGVDHLRQSIVDILTTPIGSRVMRRDYGSTKSAHSNTPSSDKLLFSGRYKPSNAIEV